MSWLTVRIALSAVASFAAFWLGARIWGRYPLFLRWPTWRRGKDKKK